MARPLAEVDLGENGLVGDPNARGGVSPQASLESRTRGLQGKPLEVRGEGFHARCGGKG